MADEIVDRLCGRPGRDESAEHAARTAKELAARLVEAGRELERLERVQERASGEPDLYGATEELKAARAAINDTIRSLLRNISARELRDAAKRGDIGRDVIDEIDRYRELARKRSRGDRDQR